MRIIVSPAKKICSEEPSLFSGRYEVLNGGNKKIVSGGGEDALEVQ